MWNNSFPKHVFDKFLCNWSYYLDRNPIEQNQVHLKLQSTDLAYGPLVILKLKLNKLQSVTL